jgi:hypothetical protein
VKPVNCTRADSDLLDRIPLEQYQKRGNSEKAQEIAREIVLMRERSAEKSEGYEYCRKGVSAFLNTSTLELNRFILRTMSVGLELMAFDDGVERSQAAVPSRPATVRRAISPRTSLTLQITHDGLDRGSSLQEPDPVE